MWDQEAIDLPPETTTYRRGTKQIDFVMCTPNIMPYIRHIELQEFGHICSSDHRGFIFDIDMKKWIKHIRTLVNNPKRALNSKKQ